MTDLLNTAQRNSLAITLRAFETHLRQADAWLQGAEERGVLYHRQLDLSPKRRVTARAQIAAGLAQIATLAERFGLAAAQEDLGATIAAQMTTDWANLSDARSNKLHRYGKVDSRVADLLDADLDALAQVALIVAALSRESPAP